MGEALAPHRADESFGEGILPPAVWRGWHVSESHARDAVSEHGAVDPVAIAEERGGGGVVREGVDELLSGPAGGGMRGDVEVDDVPAVVSEHDENEEHPQARRRHGEDVERDHVADVVGERGLPGLGRREAPPRHQPGDGALGDLEAELQELSVDARGTPERMRGGQFPNQGSDLDSDARTTSGRPTRTLGPGRAETAARPAQDGVGGARSREAAASRSRLWPGRPRGDGP